MAEVPPVNAVSDPVPDTPTHRGVLWYHRGRQEATKVMSRLEEISEELLELMRHYRLQCLWYMPPDYEPRTEAEAIRVLESIQRYGDVEAFKRAGKLKQWLLRDSSAASAD